MPSSRKMLLTMVAVATLGLQAQAQEETTGSASSKVDEAAVAQILLDRVSFSPGAIDGLPDGVRTRNALSAFQKANDLEVTGKINDETMQALKKAWPEPPITEYTISKEDVDGPFAEEIPDDWKKLSKMDRLSYKSVEEKLAEKFHVTQEYLRQLNPDAQWKEGQKLTVPNVKQFVPPANENDDSAEKDQAKKGEADKIVISGKEKSLQVLSKDAKVLFYGPITPGSEDLPLPSGTLDVKGVAKSPKYYFNPEVIKEADVKEKLTIPPGPNNPVGVVWIDLSKDNYGIHGTPEPSKIGYTTSHGCVRLTNWDAMEVAGLVKNGMKVEFK